MEKFFFVDQDDIFPSYEGESTSITDGVMTVKEMVMYLTHHGMSMDYHKVELLLKVVEQHNNDIRILWEAIDAALIPF